MSKFDEFIEEGLTGLDKEFFERMLQLKPKTGDFAALFVLYILFIVIVGAMAVWAIAAIMLM